MSDEKRMTPERLDRIEAGVGIVHMSHDTQMAMIAEIRAAWAERDAAISTTTELREERDEWRRRCEAAQGDAAGVRRSIVAVTERCAKLDEELAAERQRTDALVAALGRCAYCSDHIYSPDVRAILAARKERP